MYSEGGSLQECILPGSRGAPGRAGESGREQIRAERAPICAPIPDTAKPRPLLPLSASNAGRRPLLISMPLMMVPLAQQPPGGMGPRSEGYCQAARAGGGGLGHRGDVAATGERPHAVLVDPGTHDRDVALVVVGAGGDSRHAPSCRATADTDDYLARGPGSALGPEGFRQLAQFENRRGGRAQLPVVDEV